MSTSQKHGRGKGRRRERMVPSFLWRDVRIYLPYIFIPQDLRRVADNYSLENKKSQSDHSQKSEDENWNPSWSDDEEDEGFRVTVESPKKAELERSESETVNEHARVEKSGLELEDKQMGPTERRYACKNELFKNLMAGVSSSHEPNAASAEAHACEQKKNTIKANSSTPSTSKLPTAASNTLNASAELKCLDCGKEFSKSIHLTLHKKLHAQMLRKDQINSTGRSGESIKCSKCGRKFERRNQWKFHVSLCQGRKLVSGVDFASSPSSNNAAADLDNFHQGSLQIQHTALSSSQASVLSKFSCLDCGRKFKHQHYLQFHMKSHLKACNKCGSKIQESKICQHEETCGTINYPIIPGEKSFGKQDIPSGAESELNHSVITSQSSTKQFDLLELHGELEFFESTNSQEFLSKLPFKCENLGCSNRFSHQSDLDYHIQKIHIVKTNKKEDNHDSDSPIELETSGPVYHNINDVQNLPNPYVLLIKCSEFGPDKIRLSNSDMERSQGKNQPKPGGRRLREDIPLQSCYTCQACGKKFYQRRLYLVHLREEKYRCQICKKGFPADSVLQAHAKKCSDPSYAPKSRIRTDIPFQDIYTCSVCNKDFDKRSYYMSHLTLHKYQCEICERGFPNQVHLEAHKKRHEDPSYTPGPRIRTDIPFQDTYTCQLCNKNFDKRSYYISHLSLHKKRCEICNVCFPSETLLEEHKKRHEEDPSYILTPKPRVRTDIPFENVYQCKTCDKKFYKRHYYLIHLSHHKREEQNKCLMCDRKFLSRKLLESHKKRHEDPSYTPGSRFRADIPFQDTYTCQLCSKDFDKRSYYISHLSLHKKRCNICNVGFVSQTLLEAHKKRHEDDPTYRYTRKRRVDIPFQNVYHCQICNKKFVKRHFYLIHLSLHRREEKYKCNICENKFHSRKLLESHQKRHEDPSYIPRRRIRPVTSIQSLYTCEICSKIFKVRTQYAHHLSQHQRERTFEAYTQGQSEDLTQQHSNPTFRSRPGLVEVLTQESYTCVECNKQFNDKQKFMVHINYHKIKKGNLNQQDSGSMEVKRFKCDDCLKSYSTKHVLALHRHKFCKKVPCQFKCAHCSERFANKITLARHKEKMHSEQTKSSDIPEDLWKHHCSLCSQTFATIFGLTKHTAMYHAAESNFMGMGGTHDGGGIAGRTVLTEENDRDSDEYDYGMLATSFCEAELLENPTPPEVATFVAKKRTGGLPAGLVKTRESSPLKSKTCACITKKYKYKSQKFCHTARCPCVHSNRRCDKRCTCKGRCLNTDARESEQQQIFKESKENILLEESRQQNSPVNDSFLDEDDRFSDSEGVIHVDLHVDLEASTNTLEADDAHRINDEVGSIPSTSRYCNAVMASEFIAVKEDLQDESIRQLALSGYVEGAGFDEDPLADSDPFPQVSPGLVEMESPHPQVPIPEAPQNLSKSMNTEVVQAHNSTTSCTIPINTNSGVVEHIESECRPLQCPFCKKNFKVIPGYIAHMLNHANDGDGYTCPLCSKYFTPIAVYLQHMDSHNKDNNKKFQCAKCSSKFTSYKDIEKHLKVYHSRPMECGLCSTKFADSTSLLSHWTKDHPTCQCGLCYVKFFSYEDMTVHMKALHSPFECTRCNERTEAVDDLIVHFIQEHVSELPQRRIIVEGAYTPNTFKCVFCDAIFGNRVHLNQHLRNHLNQVHQNSGSQPAGSRVLTCETCNQTFATEADLHEHLANHILGTPTNWKETSSEQQVTTSSSSEVYASPVETLQPTSGKIATLINDNTEAAQTFTCEKCGKGFPTKRLWMTHLRCHKNTFLCSACLSIFDTIPDLRNHLQNSSCVVHECKACFKNFVAAKYLTLHMKYHDTNKVSLKSGHSSSSSPLASTSEVADTETSSGFPVIIASKSLAQPQPQVQQPVNQLTVGPPNQTSPWQLMQIDEIILD